MCRAVELKTREAEYYGVKLSQKNRILALAARHVRAFFVKLEAVGIFDRGDFAYPVGEDLRGILWSLNIIAPKIKEDLKRSGRSEWFGKEIDGMAIEILAAKFAEKGKSPKEFAAIVKMKAPDRNSLEKQPIALFL